MEWNENLAPEIKDHPCMSSFTSYEDVCKSYVGAQSLIGVDKIPVPKDEKDENWGVVYNRLGRPEKPEGYKMEEVKDLPEGFKVTDESVKEYMNVAHQHGLSQKQAAGLYDFYIKQQGSQYGSALKGVADAAEATSKALRVEYGAAYDGQIALANKTLQHLAGEDSKELAAKYGNDPKFIKMMVKVGNDMSEDILGTGAPRPGAMTPAAALKEANAMLGDASSALNNALHPEHKAAVQRYTELNQLAHPGTEED